MEGSRCQDGSRPAVVSARCKKADQDRKYNDHWHCKTGGFPNDLQQQSCHVVQLQALLAFQVQTMLLNNLAL